MKITNTARRKHLTGVPMFREGSCSVTAVRASPPTLPLQRPAGPGPCPGSHCPPNSTCTPSLRRLSSLGLPLPVTPSSGRQDEALTCPSGTLSMLLSLARPCPQSRCPFLCSTLNTLLGLILGACHMQSHISVLWPLAHPTQCSSQCEPAEPWGLRRSRGYCMVGVCTEAPM